MTENEAIKILDTQKQCIDKSSSGQCKIHCGDCKKNIPITYQEKSYEVAITALKEVQKYRAIGTVEDFINLKRGAAIMSDLYKFGYTLDETIETMRDVIDTGNHDRMFLDTCYWLKMLSEYREIGTVEECQEAVEKQKAKKPHRNYKKFSGLWCKCGWYLGQKQCLDIKYCPNCGQAIDENLEGMEDENT